ncbi:septum site-determining protein MinC [Salirhabdus sp. Marseille-P4669]|uniref:septum site-determining protein MinC n=1 Tax=Salirhabdus sp. Marseille-P4669 TaxID=2042310 RepID=UPI000C7C32C0|nr:septum site-determining protein MinC [Salirhabdus sp. Marseille-P4669]
MKNKNQAVTIKGTKNGLTFNINEKSSYSDIIKELKEKLSTTVVESDHPMVKVNIHVGNRYLTPEMREEISEIIRNKQNFIIQEIVSNVIQKKEAEEFYKSLEVTTLTSIIRSGQVMHVNGDVLLIGDVNPGGKISATGNIYILGRLNGIAHAGYDGNRDAIVAASYMNPTQLRISDLFSRSPDYETEGISMEYAYIDEESETILIDRLHKISKIRPNIGTFERRIMNG